MKAALVSGTAGHIATAPPVLIVSLDSLGLIGEEDQRTIVRHELVHVEQAIRGDLCYNDGALQTWKGEAYEGDLADVNGGVYRLDLEALVEYLGLPWEREAYVRSEGE